MRKIKRNGKVHELSKLTNMLEEKFIESGEKGKKSALPAKCSKIISSIK